MRSFLIFRNRVPIGTIEGTTIHDAQAKAWFIWDAGVRVYDACEDLDPYLMVACRKRQTTADIEERITEAEVRDELWFGRLARGFLQAGWRPDETDDGGQPT